MFNESGEEVKRRTEFAVVVHGDGSDQRSANFQIIVVVTRFYFLPKCHVTNLLHLNLEIS